MALDPLQPYLSNLCAFNVCSSIPDTGSYKVTRLGRMAEPDFFFGARSNVGMEYFTGSLD